MNTPTVLITGALTGIGRATALAFAREGANVVVSGRRGEAGQQLATELRAIGVRAEFLRADVTDEAQVRSLVSQTVERFGRLDVAVNNAGVEGDLGSITGQTAANYRATFDTNVLGTIGWDLSRFGIQFVASPRHADGLLITGPVTKAMELALKKTYAAVPDPKIVIAVGKIFALTG